MLELEWCKTGHLKDIEHAFDWVQEAHICTSKPPSYVNKNQQWHRKAAL